MENNHPAFAALVRLHADTAGNMQDNKAEALKLIEDMKHIEAVLKMLQPDFNANKIAAKRRIGVNPVYKRGQVSRAVLDFLRTAPEPMSAEEIGVALMKAKGIPNPTRDQRRLMYGGVATSLRTHLGTLVETEGMHPRRWRLKAS